MSPAEIEAELKALREKQDWLEKELAQSRPVAQPTNYVDWWNGLDTNWKILFWDNTRYERTWDLTWRWASDWDVAQLQPTPKLYEKAAQIRIFSCTLHFTKPKISSLEPLALVTSLEGLHCGKSGVDDLAPLEKLTQVTHLDIRDTWIDDLRPIAGWSKLEELNYQHNFSQHKDDLSPFLRLKSLNIRYGHLDDLSCLASLTELDYLNIGYTNARSLRPLFSHTNLRKIYMPKTLIPLSEVEEFKQLHPECIVDY